MSEASSSACALATPSATYRLQFHADFPFARARALAPYFRALGVTHVYASPILRARVGSRHGYDIVDYTQINPELGGETGFREFADALRAQGVGIILDIVPNHMAVGGDDNRLWLDVLKRGRRSRFAKWFDIDFDCADPLLRDKVHAPFLGAPYREELVAGRLSLQPNGGDAGFAIVYGEHRFPICPEDEAEIARAGLSAYRDPQRLDALIARQNFVLDWWRNAGDRINWRRFFDITQLAAMRMEEPEAFDAAHAVTFRLYGEGLIDGVRVDHVDGLADPQAYCRSLRARLAELEPQRPRDCGAGPAWIVVEKILQACESLPQAWGVAGTTGYDFMDQVSALQHAGGETRPLEDHWASLSGRPSCFALEEEAARRQILDHHFDGARESLVQRLLGLARPEASITPAAMRRAVTQLLAHMRVYRLYQGGGAGHLQEALAAARRDPVRDEAALELVGAALLDDTGVGDAAARADAIGLFNRVSAPLAAKAVEDTAFYRYGRLLSRNDVGFDAATLAISRECFHATMCAHASDWPRAMLATATHDHKRGEDIRARLAVVSEAPEAWIAAHREWATLNAPIRPAAIEAGDEYHFYQMLAGAWPLDLHGDDASGLHALRDRLLGWRKKSLREAKLRSSWAAPDAAYEKAWIDFLSAALEPSLSAAFLASMHAYVQTIAGPGAANSLVQLTLRCTAPGIPDQYQGTEFWDFSFVDPDNRRTVDYEARQQALARTAPLDVLANDWRSGEVKQQFLRLLLNVRRDHPGAFAGTYEPLESAGSRADHVLAFLRKRESEAVLVVAGLHLAHGCAPLTMAPKADWWGDTRIALDCHITTLEPIIGPAIDLQHDIFMAQALEHLPVGVWRMTLA